jgi:hypothetical protein
MLASNSMFARHALVIMLVILSALAAVERGQAMVIAVQHSLMIDHTAPVLELAAANHDHHHDHHLNSDDGQFGGVADEGDSDQAPGPHHHHSEGPQVGAPISPVTIDVAVSDSAAIFMCANTGSAQSRIFDLERPPKTLSDRA